MRTLEQMREEEALKYPDLKVSLWHIKDVMSLTYMDEQKRALTVYLTPDLTMKNAMYKEYRYDTGRGTEYTEVKDAPDWTRDIYNDYQMSSIKETSFAGFKTTLSNIGFDDYERSDR